jgi:hypothetical protein
MGVVSCSRGAFPSGYCLLPRQVSRWWQVLSGRSPVARCRTAALVIRLPQGVSRCSQPFALSWVCWFIPSAVGRVACRQLGLGLQFPGTFTVALLLRSAGLTPPSRGLACGQPLTSNVGPLIRGGEGRGARIRLRRNAKCLVPSKRSLPVKQARLRSRSSRRRFGVSCLVAVQPCKNSGQPRLPLGEVKFPSFKQFSGRSFRLVRANFLSWAVLVVRGKLPAPIHPKPNRAVQ